MESEAILTIEKLGHQGDGLAPWKKTENRFMRASVAFTLPGEEVRARLHETEDHAHGTLLEILKASPARQKPVCTHFGSCGGCRLQHAPTDVTAALKMDQVARALSYNNISYAPTAIFTTPLHTRRRVSLHAKKVSGKVLLGFQRRESHDIVPITACPVLKPRLEKLLVPLANFLNPFLGKEEANVQLTELHGTIELCLTGLAAGTKMEVTLTAFCTEYGISRAALRAEEKNDFEVVFNARPLTARYGDALVNLPPAPFLQASDEAEEAMLAFLRPHMEGISSYADLFCGTGLFALSFYGNGKKVLAADVDGPALKALESAAPRGSSIKTLRRNLMREPVTAVELKDYPVVLLDPPRAGAREQCLEIAKAKPKKVLYVSCNPQSFARDARILYDGGYSLHDLKVFDQFLYSHHTEVIGVFTL